MSMWSRGCIVASKYLIRSPLELRSCSSMMQFVEWSWVYHDWIETLSCSIYFYWCLSRLRMCQGEPFLLQQRKLRFNCIGHCNKKKYCINLICALHIWSESFWPTDLESWIWGAVEKLVPAFQHHLLLIHILLWVDTPKLLLSCFLIGFTVWVHNGLCYWWEWIYHIIVFSS